MRRAVHQGLRAAYLPLAPKPGSQQPMSALLWTRRSNLPFLFLLSFSLRFPKARSALRW